MRSLTFTSPVRWAAGLFFAALMAAGVASWAQDARTPEPLSTAEPNAAIRERIRAFESPGKPPLDVLSFTGPDQRPVYLFNGPCCDHFNRLYDGEGRFICAPTGGFGGAGDGKCPAWVADVLSQRVLRVPASWREQPQPRR